MTKLKIGHPINNDTYCRSFELVVLYCERTLELIPLAFVLGFYVTFVVTRWWNQFMTIPWPDRYKRQIFIYVYRQNERKRIEHLPPFRCRIMNVVTMYVRGRDDESRIIRRTLMRYVNLSFVLVAQSISIAVKKRFPSLNHLIEAGLYCVAGDSIAYQIC